ncbi:MAG: peptidase M54 [Bacteroidota bacterium]
MNPIILLPLGDADRTLVAGLRPAIREGLGRPAIVREADIDLSLFYDELRLQYNSSAIIAHLDRQFSELAGAEHPGASLLAVSGEDLCIPILTFVFGEAQLNGRVGIVSYHRLQNERYGLAANQDLLESRLRKEALHELGHIHGLVHCPSFECVMHISTYAEDIDGKSTSFCSSCRQHLESQTGV